MRIKPELSRAIFNNPPKPSVVTEHQFDGFDDELKKIANLDWTDIEDGDLWYYIHDLAYVDLQKDLFDYLFPVCLDFWYQSLMRSESAECGDAEFHYALRHGDVLRKMTTEVQTDMVYQFFIDGFMDRVEIERGFDYRGEKTPVYALLYRFNSLGYIAPVIERLWTQWWEFDLPGKAVSAIKYASGLIYLKGDNPIFDEWTGKKGGGGPYLTESDASIFDAGWMAENLAFMKKTLSVGYIQNKMQQACDCLVEEPEHDMAAQVARESLINDDVIQLRIDDLLEGLSKPEAVVNWE